MKRWHLLAAAALLVTANAEASYFESCELDGEIQRVTTDAHGDFEFSVLIAHATRAKEESLQSSSDCHAHIGEALEAHFSRQEIPAHPAAGDAIRFHRSVIDGVDANGHYAGSNVLTRLHSIQHPPKRPAAAADRGGS